MIKLSNFNFWVCVRCYTYNHASFIADAMDGFAMQQTSFPFICKIVDDASTDGEQKVILNYLNDSFSIIYRTKDNPDFDYIVAQHKRNLNCIFAVYLLKYNHYQLGKSKIHYMQDGVQDVKYIASCEGDDYWTVPFKLQKQVDYLESHPDHSLCIHAYRQDDYNGSAVHSHEVHKYSCDVDIIPPIDVLAGKGMFCATASKVYRREFIENYPEWARKAIVGDKPMKLVLFSRGPIAYMDDVMCVYRVGVGGSWTSRISNDHHYLKKNRIGLLNVNKEFDEWTNGKYHKLIMKSNRLFVWSCIKADIKSLFGFKR